MFADAAFADILRLTIELGCFALLLLLSAFFSSSETSMFSLKRAQLEDMRLSKKPGYSLIAKMLNEPRRLIVTILIGNELVNITASALSATIIIRLFGADNSYLNLLVVTPLLLVFGEITPKTLALKNNVAFATFEAPLIQRFAQIITPVRIAIRFVSEGIITLLVGKKRTAGSLITQDMVLTLAQEAEGDGVLESNEAFYIRQIFRFGETRVDEVMTPRSNVKFIASDASVAEVITKIKGSHYTKLPVYTDDQDMVIGILFGRDLLTKNTKKLSANNGLKSLVREAYFVPGTRQVIDLFHHFRSKRISMAMVLDEYGGITGLVTMDDLLHCIFSDLPNIAGTKNDASKRKKYSLPDNVDALMPVSECNRLYSCQLPTTITSTLNGLFMHHYGELPKKGTEIELERLTLTVMSMKGNRINQLRIERESKKTKKSKRVLFSRNTSPSNKKSAPTKSVSSKIQTAIKSTSISTSKPEKSTSNQAKSAVKPQIQKGNGNAVPRSAKPKPLSTTEKNEKKPGVKKISKPPPPPTTTTTTTTTKKKQSTLKTKTKNKKTSGKT